MLSSRNFWFGVVAGLGTLYVYNRYAMRKSSQG
jgi:hypothetical protein